MNDEFQRRKQVTLVSPEEKAAMLAFDKLLKSLSAARGDDIVVSCEADLKVRYTRLLQATKEYTGRFDIGIANKVHMSVLRPVIRPLKSVKSRVYLTRESIALAAQILAEAIGRSPRDGKHKKGLEKLIKRCGSTLADFASATSDGFHWTQVLSFFQNAASASAERFESLVSETNLGTSFAILQSGLTNGIYNLLESGDVAAARQLLLACARHSDLQEACHAVLNHALSDHASSLPRDSQELAMRVLGVNSQSDKLDYANPAESPEMRQAAALLLYLFDMHDRNLELDEAFERYRTVAEQQFSLYLRGTVGSKTVFDARLHEAPESGVSDEVRVVRPWVEWYKPPDAAVVIRGIVESGVTGVSK